MLTQEQVITSVKGGRESGTIDGRDYSRLAKFFPASELKTFGFSIKDGSRWEPEPWNEEAIRRQLTLDVEFAFEKAYGQRSISSECMHEVVKMWMWVLEDECLRGGEDYDDYGIGYLRRVAAAHGLADPGS